MTDKFWGAMGLCRRAGKLFVGHDEVKSSVKRRKAKLVIFSSDASERLQKEIRNLAESIPCIVIEADMNEAKFRIGKGAAVFSISDEGLSEIIKKETNV